MAEESDSILGGLNYSTQGEKDEESRTVKYAYEVRDKAVLFMKY